MPSSPTPHFTNGSRGSAVRWTSLAGPWLQQQKTRLYLIALTDEITGQVEARLAATDSCHENLLLLQQYVARFGCPRAIVTNGKTIFRGNPRTPLVTGNSRIQRVLADLRIDQIIEPVTNRSIHARRFLRHARKSLSGGLRSRKADSLEQANVYLREQFVEWWNSLCPVALGTDAHRLPQADLELVFSEVSIRKVQAGLICYQGEYYSVEPASGDTVRIEERMNGSVHASIGDAAVRLIRRDAPLQKVSAVRVRERVGRGTVPKKPPTNKRWMEDFFQRPPRPLWSILKPSRFGD